MVIKVEQSEPVDDKVETEIEDDYCDEIEPFTSNYIQSNTVKEELYLKQSLFEKDDLIESLFSGKFTGEEEERPFVDTFPVEEADYIPPKIERYDFEESEFEKALLADETLNSQYRNLDKFFNFAVRSVNNFFPSNDSEGTQDNVLETSRRINDIIMQSVVC